MRLLIVLFSLVMFVAYLAVTSSPPSNLHDSLDIKCGKHLQDTCPSTRINWR